MSSVFHMREGCKNLRGSSCLPDVCSIDRLYHWTIFLLSVETDLIGVFDVVYMCHQNISSVAVVSGFHDPQLWSRVWLYMYRLGFFLSYLEPEL